MAKKAANTTAAATADEIKRKIDEAIGSAPIGETETDGMHVRVYDAPKTVEDFHGLLHTIMDGHSLGIVASLVETIKGKHPETWKTVEDHRPEFEKEESEFASGYIAALGACIAICTKAMEMHAKAVTAVHDDPKADPETKAKALLAAFGEGLAIASAAQAMIGYTVRSQKLSEKTKNKVTHSALPMYDKIVSVFAHMSLMPLAEKLVALKQVPPGATVR